jgi:cell division protein FtsZ
VHNIESTVRPIASAPAPASNKDVARGVASLYNTQPAIPLHQPQQKPANAEPAAEPASAAYGVSDDVLEIPAFLRRQAN